MECGSCGSINRDGARFCIGCGAPLAPHCPSCGVELPTTAKFCDSCGAPVRSEPIAPDLTPTRKIVTVLFSDLTGSTALGERMDPESFRALMAPVYASMRNEVESRGGIVTKFVGDGVMAVFGIPDIREDDAMRAVDAAVGMQQAIARLSVDLPVALSLKVGVNTGEVVVGLGDEDIVGDCVNVAARFEGAAAPGEVLVGEETWRLTRTSATYEPVAPLTLKGKAQPVPAFRLVSLERTQEAGTATFVGRDDELLRLQAAFDDAVEQQASRLVTIVGSPGLGKTRLARELGVSLRDRAFIIETRCDAAGTATFAPVVDALRSAAEIGESASPDEVLEAMRQLAPDDDDRDRIAARVAAILGAGEPGSTEETFWAIRRIVETAARVQPLVLILDDLHWGEPLLFDLVEHLAEWNRTSPVLIVVTGRPELREMRPRLTDGAISLEGLDGGATEALACGLLGTTFVPRELLARLPASTEGNPLFVREFVRMLVDDGILRRTHNGWRATIDVDAIQIPPTIHSLLAARVDRLTPNERTVLELASVIGKEFYMGAIAELAPAAVRVDLSAHLESLRRKELVEPSGTYWIDEPVFRFHHALIQDAAYRRLLKESRADLHERVADWLQRKTGALLGEHDELIGYHLEQAHECRRQLGIVDDHVQELGKRAGRLLASAARAALDLDDLPSAAGLAGRALARLDDTDPDRADVLLVRCEALLATGDVARAADAVAELERVAASSPRLVSWATCFSGELANMTDPSRLRETEVLVAAAAAEFASLGDPAGAAKAYTVQAISLAGLGRVADCESALDRALTAARDAGDRRRVTAVLGFAPVAALWGPSPVSRAGGRCLDIVRLLRITTGSPAVEATSDRCQAVLEAFRGRAPAARRMLLRVRAGVEELGLRQGLLETELFSGIVELVAADPVAAEFHLRAAHDGFRSMGNDVSTARAAALLARALLAMEEEEEAAIYVRESERLGGDDLKNAIAWRAVRAELLARRGEFDQARRLADEAVEIASRTDALVDHADACVALAEVCRRAGDAEGARLATEAAVALYERKGASAFVEAMRTTPVAPSPAAPPVTNESNRAVRLVADWAALIPLRRYDELPEIFTPETVYIDHRPLVKDTVTGPSDLMALARAIGDIGTRRIDVVPVAMRGETIALARLEFRGRDVGEQTFGQDILLLFEMNDADRVVYAEAFETEQIADGVSALDRRYQEAGGPFSEVVALSSRAQQAINTEDWETAKSFFAPEFVEVDHRQASFGELRGHSGLESVMGMSDVVDHMFMYARSVAAIRADGWVMHVVSDGSMHGGAAVEIDYWGVAIVRDGRFVRMERFASDDRDAAIARFDELGADIDLENRCARVAQTYLDAVLAGDFDTLAVLASDDVIGDDRRRLFRSTIRGREDVLEGNRGVFKSGVNEVQTTVVATRGERLALLRELFTGSMGEVEAFFLWEIDFSDHVVATTVFDLDDLDAALAELDARQASIESGVSAFDTMCVRTWTRACELIERGDWDGLAEVCRADCVSETRRSGLRDVRTGIDQFIESLQAARDVGVTRLILTPLAVRGERFAIGRVIATGDSSGSFSAELLNLVEVDGSGRLVREILFDPEALDVALTELDLRFAEAEDSGLALVNEATRVQAHGGYEEPEPLSNRCSETFERVLRLFEARDWDALADLYDDDGAWISHRSGLRDVSRGREGLLEGWIVTAEVGATRVTSEVLAVRGEDLALTRGLFRADDDSTDAFVVEVLFVNELNEAGRITHADLMDAGDLAFAMAELDARSREHAAETETLVIRTERAIIASFFARDWDAFDDLRTPDFVTSDRRLGLGNESTGREAPRKSAQVMASIGVQDVTFNVMATRGDRLALISERFAGGPDTTFEAINVQVLECDEQGRMKANISFDVDAMDDAFAELEARYVAGEGAAVALTLRATRFIEAYNARDWAAFGAALADDVVLVDHRPASLGRVEGREAMVDAYKTITDLAPDARSRVVEIHAINDFGAVVSAVLAGHSVDGGEIELPTIGLVRTTGGIVNQIDTFPTDGLDVALEAFEELADLGDAGQRNGMLERVYRRFTSAFGRRDWKAVRDVFSERAKMIDRRSGLAVELDGRAAIVGFIKEVADLGFARSTFDVVAERGERLGLLDVVRESADGFIAEQLVVVQLDDDWRICTQVRFDHADREAALDELDQRYMEGEGRPYAALVMLGQRFVGAFNTRSFDDFSAILTDDVVSTDRRLASFGRMEGLGAVIDTLMPLAEIGARMHVAEVPAIADDAVIVHLVIGTTVDGAHFEWPFLAVLKIDDGKVCSQDVFPIDQRTEALALFDDLTADSSDG